MALIGNIEPFSDNGLEFESYLERLEHLFVVNFVRDKLKVPMYITLAGPQVYQVLKNLAAPRKPGELSFTEAIDLLRKHYLPPVSETYERFVFNRCYQKHRQAIAEYIVELRKLANRCNFIEDSWMKLYEIALYVELNQNTFRKHFWQMIN